MPRLETDNRPIVVFVSIWKDQIWAFDEGKRIDFKRIPEARDWARGKGKAITIRIPGGMKKVGAT